MRVDAVRDGVQFLWAYNIDIDPPEIPMTKAKAPWTIAAAFLLVTLAVNLWLVPYPADNDLDEVGWLVQHLSLSRPVSLANANYPPGLPIVLRLLIPITGDLLRTALALQALACSVIIVVAYWIVLHLMGDARAATLAAVLTAGMVFRSATSEFADGIAAALLLAGLAVLVTSDDRRRRLLLAGVLMGAAYLFRYHYLTGLILVPGAAFVLPGDRALRVRRSLTLAGGFLIGCSPLMAVNVLAHWNPFYTGVSPYILGQHVMKSVDWRNYLATYDTWPVGRLLAEQPMAVVRHVASGAAGLAYRATILAGVVLIPISVGLTKRPETRRWLAFLVVFVAGYLALVVVPTLATDRVLLPVDVLLGILVLPGLYLGSRSLVRDLYPVRIVALALAVLLLVSLPTSVHHIRQKHRRLKYNRLLCDKLRRAGAIRSSEVFSTSWDIYPLYDPGFVTFYNYGGWLLLDPEYARQRPAPTARTVGEWQGFMQQHGLRFLLMRKTRSTAPFFDEDLDATVWEAVHYDGVVGIVKLKSD